MKTVKVVAAVICDSLENKTRIYATARGYGDYKGWWEFPGGEGRSWRDSTGSLKKRDS